MKKTTKPLLLKSAVMTTCILLSQLLLPLTLTRADSQTPPVISAACSTFKTNEGYYFGDYEQHEYVNGFLVMHFQLKTPYNDGRGWNNTFTLYNSSCGFETDVLNFAPSFNPRPGMQNFSINFTSPTHYKYWDNDLNAPVMCGTIGCEGDLPTIMKDGSVASSVAYTPTTGDSQWLISDSFPIVGGTPARDPVIIIPGLLGSQLFDSSNNNKFIWPNLASMLADPDDFLTPLAMNPDGSSQNPGIQVGRMISSINYSFGTLHYSDQLVADLQQQGYSLNKDLFYWPYDWRLGAVQNAVALSKKISETLQTTGAPKVDLIAHSYGGLVLKQYLIGQGSQADDAQIGKVLFVGVPQLGTAEAARALIFGSDFGFPLVGTDQVRTVSQNMSSIYDLLPSAEYFKHIAGYYADLSTNASTSGILNFNQSTALLQQLGKNAQMLTETTALHSSSFDNFDFTTKPYQVYDLVSCGVYTIKTINKMYGDPSVLKQIFDGPQYRIYADSGDGTVLQASASHLNIPTNNMFFVHGIDHAEMLSADPAKTLIENLLENQSVTTATVSHDSSACGLQGRLLSMSSAVQFEIRDSNNNLIDPHTLVNKQIGDESNIFIPDSQNYTVNIKPVDPVKPVDFSLTDIAPAKTTINNYNNVNVSGGSVNLTLSATILAKKQDSSGQSSDLPATSSTDQNNLTGDPGTPIDDGSSGSTPTSGGGSTPTSGGGLVSTGASVDTGSGSVTSPVQQNPAPITNPTPITTQDNNAPNNVVQDTTPTNQTPDLLGSNPTAQDQTLQDQTSNDQTSTADQVGNQNQSSTDQPAAVQTAPNPIQSQAPQNQEIAIQNPQSRQSHTQQTADSPAPNNIQQPIIIINSTDSVWTVIYAILAKIAKLIFF